jgi:ABC-2 type transport system permease protein
MRYLRLWLSFFKVSWMADFEYRLNLIVRVVGEFSWYVAQLSVFEVLYRHSDTISGWDVHGMRVFMGTLFLADVFYMILFMENMDNMASAVKRGDLDLYLTKPIDSQFMVSFRKIAVAYFLNLALILLYLVWAIRQLPGSLSTPQLVSFVILLVSGFISLYAIRFMFATLSVFLHDAGNVQFVWHQLYRLGTRPDPLYPSPLRLIVFTIFPVAFFASVPARVLVEGFDVRLLVAAPLVASVMLVFSHLFWNRALRSYSSASS